MIKNIQIKIILIFFLVGIVLIGALGTFYMYSLNRLDIGIENGTLQDLGQVTSIIANIRENTFLTLIISTAVFALIGVLIFLFLSKFVIYPINKLIKSAEKIAEEDKEGNKKIKTKKKTDMGNLENVLGLMTTELKEKLSEVSTQKNQIETILLHMTDGIIAFNRKGEIILINPAAKKFLSIGPEDNTFDDIFKKYDVSINMEKIIYLENWTSTEQRIKVDDNYVNVFFAPFKNDTERPDGVIYWTDGKTCWVKTGVIINDIEHIEYLPVMDYKNNSIPLEKVTSFDVNKAIQRSLTKACARHGLGLYVYAGEDLPESESEAMERELSEIIDSIEGLVQSLINEYKINKSEISNIIKSMVTVNGKPTANYKGIKDINLAKKVYDKLYTMIKTTGGEE